MKECCCGTCKYHQRYVESKGKIIRIEWICTNVDCDLCGFETEYEYSCNDYESRDEKCLN